MKRILLLFVCVVVMGVGYAQENRLKAKAGLKGGFNFFNVTDDAQAKTRTGFYVGVFTEFPMSQFFSLSPELIYSSQGTKAEIENPIGYYKKTKMSLIFNYINVPIMAKFYTFRSRVLSFEVGPQLSFWVNAKTKANVATVDLPKEMFNKFDFSMCFGASLNFDRFLLSARYNIGMADILKEEKGKNIGFQLGGGFRF